LLFYPFKPFLINFATFTMNDHSTGLGLLKVSL